MRDYSISFFDNVTSKVPRERKLTFEEILKYFNEVAKKPFIKKENLEAMICGSFSKPQRASEYLVSRSIITYDIDNFKGNFDELLALIKKSSIADKTFIYYTTTSSTILKPRLRLMLFISKDIEAKHYNKIVQNIAYEWFPEELRDSVDKSSYSPMQLMFLPNRQSDEFRCGKHIGHVFDANEFLDGDCNDDVITPVISLSSTNVKEQKKEENLEVLTKELVTYHKNLPLEIPREKIDETLSAYDCNETDYYSWFMVCQALHHQFKGSEEGLELFTKWSLTDDRYNQDQIKRECKDKYYSLKRKTDKPITFASVISLVNKKKGNEDESGGIIYKMIEPSKFKDFKIKYSKKGESIITGIKCTYTNFKILCGAYKISIAYDVILKRNISSVNNTPVEVDDNYTYGHICNLCNLNNIDRGLVREFIHMLAQDNKYNSFKFIMDNVTWDGVSRFDDFCNTIEVPKPYYEVRRLYLKKWLQQMLYLSLNEDKYNRKIGRYILVFQGGQYGGKTTWVKNLLPAEYSDNYIGTGRVLDTHNDMNIYGNIKYLIVELGELEQSFKKSDINNFKAFFGRYEDTLNIKYLAHPVTFMRTTSFVASVNETSFLKDPTGSTRFFVLPVKDINGMHGLDMLQLYKEILETTDVYNFDMSKEEREIQAISNKEFEMPDIIEEVFLDNFDVIAEKDEGDYFSAVQILEQMGYGKKDITHNRRIDIGRVLNKYKCYQNTHLRKWKLRIKQNNRRTE